MAMDVWKPVKRDLPMILALPKLRRCPHRNFATQALTCSIPAACDSPWMSGSRTQPTTKKSACCAMERISMAFQSQPSDRRFEIDIVSIVSNFGTFLLPGLTQEHEGPEGRRENWKPWPLASGDGLWFETPQLGNRALARFLDADGTLVADCPFFKVDQARRLSCIVLVKEN